MSESLDSSGTNMARMITFFRAHKRLITFSLVAVCAFWLTPSWSEVGPFGFLFFFALFVMLIVSQLFWVGRVVDLGERFIAGTPRLAYGHCECTRPGSVWCATPNDRQINTRRRDVRFSPICQSDRSVCCRLTRREDSCQQTGFPGALSVYQCRRLPQPRCLPHQPPQGQKESRRVHK